MNANFAVSDAVLDASAVLAWIEGEPGGEEVGARLVTASISAVNLAEVVSKLIDKGLAPGDARRMAADLSCRVALFDREAALATGALRAETANYGLSLGDRACLGLARREGCAALTTDRAWARVDIGVEIRMLR